MSFTQAETRRYSRHLLLPEFGEAGQAKLRAARVLIVGAGGLGSPASLYLAAAGVGVLGLVDFDTVDETNLQRQILYGTADVGHPKLAAAEARLRDVNPLIAIERIDQPFAAGNARQLVDAFDVVVDGTDNFPTRYLVNDACVMTGTPNVYGSVSRFEGQAAVFAAPGGPCYRCLHPEPPPAGLIPNCGEGGVLGVLPGLIGTIQATEAIKLIAGIGEPLVGRLLLYDALAMRLREIVLPRDPECPVCSDRATIRELVAYEPVCEPARDEEDQMTVDQLRAWRREGRVHALIDVREPFEHEAASISGDELIPLGTVAAEIDRLPADRPIVVYCRSGARSARVVAMLRSAGLDAHNLVGGILAWAEAGPEATEAE
jgi:molybdopterin/thiamine biosynthesis adenylyltransferase/rhodanese-related sulfurtransferase